MEDYGYISENIENIRKNIDAACKRSGRDPKDVLLLAVSKTVDVDSHLEQLPSLRHDFPWPELPLEQPFEQLVLENKLNQSRGQKIFLKFYRNGPKVFHSPPRGRCG